VEKCKLQYINGVHIVIDLCRWPDGGLDAEVGKEGLQVRRRRGLKDNLDAVIALYPADNSGHRAANADFEAEAGDCLGQTLAHHFGGGVQLLIFCPPHLDDGHPPDGREAAGFAMLHLVFNKAGEIVLEGVLDDGCVGQPGLDDDPAGGVASAGTAGDLIDELEGAFVGAEVRQGKRGVGADDADECDVGKMQTLGEDLRAGEDVD